MIVMNIAEWISNLLVLGGAALIWIMAIFWFFMIISVSKKAMDEISVIENDTVPAGEYNLVEGWDDGPKVTVK